MEKVPDRMRAVHLAGNGAEQLCVGTDAPVPEAVCGGRVTGAADGDGRQPFYRTGVRSAHVVALSNPFKVATREHAGEIVLAVSKET